MVRVHPPRHARKSPPKPNNWQWYYADWIGRSLFWDSLCEMMSDTPAEKTANLLAVTAAFGKIKRHRTRPQLVRIAMRAIRSVTATR